MSSPKRLDRGVDLTRQPAPSAGAHWQGRRAIELERRIEQMSDEELKARAVALIAKL